MKWNKKINVIIILTIICCLLVPNNVVAANKKTTLKLNKTNSTIYVGNVIKIKAITNEKSSKIKWSINNKKIATIKKNGKTLTLTGIKNGIVKVNCKIGNKKKICNVKIKNKKKYTEKETITIFKSTLESGGMQWYPSVFPNSEAGPSGGMGWGIEDVSMTDPYRDAKKALEGCQWNGWKYYYLESQGSSNGVVHLKLYTS